MGHDPLVSIIMPLYNKRAYVKRAIDSIRQQTFSEWELIIVDDGSTDGSPTQIPQDDPRIRVFQQANAGPAAARNRGIRMALGTFVTFIDADDYYYPKKLEQEMTLLHKQKKAEWMLSAFEREANNRLTHPGIRNIEGKKIKGQPLVFDNAIAQLELAGYPINGLCINKALLNRVGGFHENMRCYEITDLIIRCAAVQPRVVICPIPLFCVVDVPGSALKVEWDRTEGVRQLGESLYHLSTYYVEFSHILIPQAKKYLLWHVNGLIRSGRNSEARKYLTNTFPYSRDKRWWKLWILSWAPEWLLKHRDRIRAAKHSVK